MRKQLFAPIVNVCLFLFVTMQLHAFTGIRNLQTEYQQNPIGIDVAQPRFNWQMTADRYGAVQSAYQLLVADSEESLKAGRYVFDSGKIESDASVGITYQGKVLQPATRYFWKVKVWDEKGTQSESDEAAWFETGLLGSGWNGAQWIGSSKPQLGKYRTHYVIDYAVEIPEGSDRAVFVFGARDKDNYVSVELNLNDTKEPQLILRHTTDGKEVEDAVESLRSVIAEKDKRKKHHIQLNVTTAQYALKYSIDIKVDGVSLTNSALSHEESERKSRPDYWGNKEGMFTVHPYPGGDLVYLCRLYAVGFKQPAGQKATFSAITIGESTWNTTLYSSNETNYAEDGKGELHTWLPGEDRSAPMFRKTIQINKPIKQARLYATARGIYTFSINGKKVSNDYFNPGWTDYRYRIMYNTYDITNMLQSGKNGVGAMLGTGWWSEHNGFLTGWQDQYGTRESLMAKIQIEYTDGTKETLVTDGSWKCYDNGPITYNSFQNGEEYDARKELSGWDMPDLDESRVEWGKTELFPAPTVNTILQGYVGSPIQNNLTLTAVSMVEALPGVYVYDMGQNMVGVPRLKLNGKAGQEILIRFGEMNYPESIPTDPVAPYTIEMYKQKKGQVYTDNYRSALSTDRYICKGDAGGEVYEPTFTFHGYRYVEIHGLDAPLALDEVKGVVLESIGEQTSSYDTSDERINRLYENILWGQRGNFLSVPTDCPQRDERMGWTGDAQVFARTATYNMNVNPFYTRWLYSVRDNQGTDGSYANYIPVVGFPPRGAEAGGGAMGWMEAGIIVPWQIAQQYNDVRVLEDHYASMVAYMDYLERRAVNYIQPFGGFGDWLAVEPTNSMLTNTAYAAYDALIMEQVAQILGKEADSKRFRLFYENVKKSFNDVFVNAEGRTFAPPAADIFGSNVETMWPGTSPGGSKEIDTQTSYVVPLQFDLFNEKNKPLALKHLVENIESHNYTLTTGFIGTPYLNLVLSDNGYDDIAYKLFEQTAYPSWLYPVLQGATTIWERWNSYTIVNGFGPVDMNSFNHYSYGAIEEWMMAYSAGIQRDENNPGYKHIILQPRIGGNCRFIRAHYDSVYGRIESGWEKQGEGYRYETMVPANTTATLYLPVSKAGEETIETGKEGAAFVGFENGKAIYKLSAGKYAFTVNK